MSKALLDLHGCRQEEVIDRLDAFLHKHIQAGSKKVRIMPGKGKGVVLKEVQNYLRQGGFPFSPERLSNGKLNEGVLIVHLDD